MLDSQVANVTSRNQTHDAEKRMRRSPCALGFTEANVLHCSSCDIVRTFRRPAVIRRPCSASASGELCSLPPVVTPLVAERRDSPQQIVVHSSNQRHTGTLGFRRGKIINSLEFLRHFEKRWIGEFCRAMVLFQKLAQKSREVFPEFFKSCPKPLQFVRL